MAELPRGRSGSVFGQARTIASRVRSLGSTYSRRSRYDPVTERKLPGAWLELDANNYVAAARLRKSSEVLRNLEELKVNLKNKDQPTPWVNTRQADAIVALTITLYAVLIGVETDLLVRNGFVPPDVRVAFTVVQGFFLLIFLIELGLRLRAEGLGYISCGNPMGLADAVIILLGTVEFVLSLVQASDVEANPLNSSLRASATLRTLRVLRLMRLMRLLLIFRELRLLIIGMLSSVKTVAWAFFLLLIFMYLGTLFCVILLSNEPTLEEYFGGVGRGLFTHFQLVTMEAWPDIADATIEASGSIWAFYFVAYICSTSLALMNLVTGVVCEKLIDLQEDKEEEGNPLQEYQDDLEDFKTTILSIFRKCDQDSSDTLDAKEFMEMLRREDMQKLLAAMDISSNLEGEQLFEILDEKGRGHMTCEEIAEALLRLRGSRYYLHSMMLQRDFVRWHRRKAAQVLTMEKKARIQIHKDFSLLETGITYELKKVEKHILKKRGLRKSRKTRRGMEVEMPGGRLSQTDEREAVKDNNGDDNDNSNNISNNNNSNSNNNNNNNNSNSTRPTTLADEPPTVAIRADLIGPQNEDNARTTRAASPKNDASDAPSELEDPPTMAVRPDLARPKAEDADGPSRLEGPGEVPTMGVRADFVGPGVGVGAGVGLGGEGEPDVGLSGPDGGRSTRRQLTLPAPPPRPRNMNRQGQAGAPEAPSDPPPALAWHQGSEEAQTRPLAPQIVVSATPPPRPPPPAQTPQASKHAGGSAYLAPPGEALGAAVAAKRKAKRKKETKEGAGEASGPTPEEFMRLVGQRQEKMVKEAEDLSGQGDQLEGLLWRLFEARLEAEHYLPSPPSSSSSTSSSSSNLGSSSPGRRAKNKQHDLSDSRSPDADPLKLPRTELLELRTLLGRGPGPGSASSPLQSVAASPSLAGGLSPGRRPRRHAKGTQTAAAGTTTSATPMVAKSQCMGSSPSLVLADTFPDSIPVGPMPPPLDNANAGNTNDCCHQPPTSAYVPPLRSRRNNANSTQQGKELPANGNVFTFDSQGSQPPATAASSSGQGATQAFEEQYNPCRPQRMSGREWSWCP